MARFPTVGFLVGSLLAIDSLDPENRDSLIPKEITESDSVWMLEKLGEGLIADMSNKIKSELCTLYDPRVIDGCIACGSGKSSESNIFPAIQYTVVKNYHVSK